MLGLTVAAVFDPVAEGCTQCPHNLLLVSGSSSMYGSINQVVFAASSLVDRASEQNVTGALVGLRASPQHPEIDPAGYLDAFDRLTAAMLAELHSNGAMSLTVVLAGALPFPGSDVMVLAAATSFSSRGP